MKNRNKLIVQYLPILLYPKHQFFLHLYLLKCCIPINFQILKFSNYFIYILLFLFLNSCSMKEKVDTIYCNARVYTVDSSFSIADAFAVKDGKFVAVGKRDVIENQYEAKETVDLQQKFVFPGFYDAHCHFYGYGLSLQQAKLAGTKSFSEVIEKLKEQAEKFPSGWLLGRGWDQNDWDVKEFPTNEELNRLFPERPIYLRRIDGHAALVNNKALQLANITKNTKIEGGKIEIINGEMTGILIDNAMTIIENIIPKPTKEEIKNALIHAQNNCFSVGLTTVDDAGLEPSVIQLIDSLQKSKELKINIYAMLDIYSNNFNEFIEKGIFKTDLLNVRSIKIYADGALGSRGAKLLDSYNDEPNNSGMFVISADSMRMFCNLAYKHGYQVCTHAIGDAANRFALEIYSKILKEKNDLRWRIEHAQVVDSKDINTFGKYSIIPSVQPTHATSDMYWAEKRLGNQRIKNAYSYKQLLQQNNWLPIGSDFPVEDINPLLGFYAAVTRKDTNSYPENGFQKENAISRIEALKGMTIWAAKSNFEENNKGSIEAGKYADFVVLDADIMTVAESEIFKINVNKTFIRGENVFIKSSTF